MKKINTMLLTSGMALTMPASADSVCALSGKEKQLTKDPVGHILTNINVFSPDSQWIVYDERSDREGSLFDSVNIKRVNINNYNIETLYTASNNANVGVVTYDQTKERVVFIHGPENPTAEWKYGGAKREGAIVETANPGIVINLDARDLIAPFTVGALRGGSHVHVYDASGEWLSFTYQDYVLEQLGSEGNHDLDQRNIGVSIPNKIVTVNKDHHRNRSGTTFTVLVTTTNNNPKPGSDEINKAYEEGWIGKKGYIKEDGSHQRHALAFLGDVISLNGEKLTEIFIVDLPDDMTQAPLNGKLEGTATTRPLPPKGTIQKRLTFTAERKYPGIQGPRFWVRSSPSGDKLAFLMKDDNGIVQIYTISPNGGNINQVTKNLFSIASAFSWSQDGKLIAYAGDNSIYVTDVETGVTTSVAPKDSERPVLPLAVVFSPDNKKIAYQREVKDGDKIFNQIFITELSN